MLIQEDPLFNDAVFDKALVLKNVPFIESIRTSFEARVSIEFYSWHCSRLVRRDFNLMTGAMYKFCYKRGNERATRELQEMLLELMFIAEMLDEEANRYPTERSPDVYYTAPLRLVSGDANQLLQALICADHALGRLGGAVVDGLLNHADRTRMFTEGFHRQWCDIKTFIFAKPNDKSAHDLGNELGLA